MCIIYEEQNGDDECSWDKIKMCKLNTIEQRETYLGLYIVVWAKFLHQERTQPVRMHMPMYIYIPPVDGVFHSSRSITQNAFPLSHMALNRLSVMCGLADFPGEMEDLLENENLFLSCERINMMDFRILSDIELHFDWMRSTFSDWIVAVEKLISHCGRLPFWSWQIDIMQRHILQMKGSTDNVGSLIFFGGQIYILKR